MLLGPERIADAQEKRAHLLKELVQGIRRAHNEVSQLTILAARLVLACKQETGVDPLDSGYIKGAEEFEE